mmetsp:Transcript_16212/g.48230  ORF Transcript_16212/g.48230 Transcript_16212/m.48230 type:complete len:286 (-) Transcript_16212:15-872(-)
MLAVRAICGTHCAQEGLNSHISTLFTHDGICTSSCRWQPARSKLRRARHLCRGVRLTRRRQPRSSKCTSREQPDSGPTLSSAAQREAYSWRSDARPGGGDASRPQPDMLRSSSEAHMRSRDTVSKLLQPLMSSTTSEVRLSTPSRSASATQPLSRSSRSATHVATGDRSDSATQLHRLSVRSGASGGAEASALLLASSSRRLWHADNGAKSSPLLAAMQRTSRWRSWVHAASGRMCGILPHSAMHRLCSWEQSDSGSRFRRCRQPRSMSTCEGGGGGWRTGQEFS